MPTYVGRLLYSFTHFFFDLDWTNVITIENAVRTGSVLIWGAGLDLSSLPVVERLLFFGCQPQKIKPFLLKLEPTNVTHQSKLLVPYGTERKVSGHEICEFSLLFSKKHEKIKIAKMK